MISRNKATSAVTKDYILKFFSNNGNVEEAALYLLPNVLVKIDQIGSSIFVNQHVHHNESVPFQRNHETQIVQKVLHNSAQVLTYNLELKREFSQVAASLSRGGLCIWDWSVKLDVVEETSYSDNQFTSFEYEIFLFACNLPLDFIKLEVTKVLLLKSRRKCHAVISSTGHIEMIQDHIMTEECSPEYINFFYHNRGTPVINGTSNNVVTNPDISTSNKIELRQSSTSSSTSSPPPTTNKPPITFLKDLKSIDGFFGITSEHLLVSMLGTSTAANSSTSYVERVCQELEEEQSVEGKGKLLKSIRQNPLAWVNADADLDAVLAKDKVGAAISVLCPKLSYVDDTPKSLSLRSLKKRGLVTDEERQRIVRQKNRENAKKARVRKEVFDIFLTHAIIKLEDILKDVKSNNYNSSNIISMMKSRARLDSFVKMVGAADPRGQDWLSVCDPDITLITVCPQIGESRSLDETDLYGGRHVCRGIKEMIENAEKRNSFVTSIFGDRTWKAESDVDDDSVNSTFTQFTYNLVIRFADTLVPSNPIVSIKFFCECEYGEDERLKSVIRQYDVRELMSQARQAIFKSRSLSALTYTMPRPYYVDTKGLLQKRLLTCWRFICMRHSLVPEHETWNEVCSPAISHTMPFPAHRPTSAIAIRRAPDIYECRGIPAIIDDSARRSQNLLKVFPNRLWAFDVVIDTNTVIHDVASNMIAFSHNFVLYDCGPKDVEMNDKGTESSLHETKLVIPVRSVVRFEYLSDRIESLEELFNVEEISKQLRMMSELVQASNLATSSPKVIVTTNLPPPMREIEPLPYRLIPSLSQTQPPFTM